MSWKFVELDWSEEAAVPNPVQNGRRLGAPATRCLAASRAGATTDAAVLGGILSHNTFWNEGVRVNHASLLPLAIRAASFISVGTRFLPCIMRMRAFAAPRSMPAQVTISGPVSSSR